MGMGEFARAWGTKMSRSLRGAAGTLLHGHGGVCMGMGDKDV